MAASAEGCAALTECFLSSGIQVVIVEGAFLGTNPYELRS